MAGARLLSGEGPLCLVFIPQQGPFMVATADTTVKQLTGAHTRPCGQPSVDYIHTHQTKSDT